MSSNNKRSAPQGEIDKRPPKEPRTDEKPRNKLSMQMKRQQLQKRCAKLGLDKRGTKALLLKRLLEHKALAEASQTELPSSSDGEAEALSDDGGVPLPPDEDQQDPASNEGSGAVEKSPSARAQANRVTVGGLRPLEVKAEHTPTAASTARTIPLEDTEGDLNFDNPKTIVEWYGRTTKELANSCEAVNLNSDGGRWELIGRLTDQCERHYIQTTPFQGVENEEEGDQCIDEFEQADFPSNDGGVLPQGRRGNAPIMNGEFTIAEHLSQGAMASIPWPSVYQNIEPWPMMRNVVEWRNSQSIENAEVVAAERESSESAICKEDIEEDVTGEAAAEDYIAEEEVTRQDGVAERRVLPDRDFSEERFAGADVAERGSTVGHYTGEDNDKGQSQSQLSEEDTIFAALEIGQDIPVVGEDGSADGSADGVSDVYDELFGETPLERE